MSSGNPKNQEGAGRPARRARSQSQPLSGLTYAMIALVAGALGIGLLLFYIYQVPNLIASGVQNQVFYILLIPWGLACSGFLFGAMRSIGRFTSRHLGRTLELGGPVVLFCLVVVGGFKLVPAQAKTFDLTVRAHSADGRDAIINSGNITIDFDTVRRTESFDSAGEANFKGVPSRFQGEPLKILARVDGYKQQWESYKLKSNVLDLGLVRAALPVTHLVGSIIIPPPLKGKGIKVLIDGQSGVASPDQLGRFDLKVNGTNGDRVRVKVYADDQLVYDDYQDLPGPVTLQLHLPH